MDTISTPEVYTIHKGQFITVPSEAWNSLCTTLNTVITAVNEIIAKLEGQQQSLKTCDDNITKLAEIVEEIYETLE